MPTITLPITAAQEAAFTASARELGLDLGAYVLSLLLKNENKRRASPRRAPSQAADDAAEAGEAEVRALVEELRQYRQAVERGEEIPEEVKRRMRPNPEAREGFARALRDIQEYAVQTGLSEMTDEEINAEIAAARRERRARAALAQA